MGIHPCRLGLGVVDHGTPPAAAACQRSAGKAHGPAGQIRDDGEIEAEPYFKRALEVDSSSINTMQNLGYIHLVTGRARDAVGMYLRAVELEPANPMLHVSLAKAFIAYGDIDSARRHVDAARSIDPHLPESLLEDIQREIVNTPTD